jgi:hypothetical protein
MPESRWTDGLPDNATPVLDPHGERRHPGRGDTTVVDVIPPFVVKGKGGYRRRALPWWAYVALGWVAVKALDRVTRSR